jgi:hypothetical protein
VNLSDPTGLAAGCVPRPGSLIKDCSAREAAEGFVEQNLNSLSDDNKGIMTERIASYLLGEISLLSVYMTANNVQFSEAISKAINNGFSLASEINLPQGLGDGWQFAEGFERGGLPFFAVRYPARHPDRVDTFSFTRGQAFRSAKIVNSVAVSAEPLAYYSGSNARGWNMGLISTENRGYWVYRNSLNVLIGIREDFGNSVQPPHFNSGRAGDVTFPSQFLPNHHYFER